MLPPTALELLNWKKDNEKKTKTKKPFEFRVREGSPMGGGVVCDGKDWWKRCVLSLDMSGSKGDQGGRGPQWNFWPPVAPKKVKDKTGTYQNYITYSVVQRESISCVPPNESVATPVAPKNENPRTATDTVGAILYLNRELRHDLDPWPWDLTWHRMSHVCHGVFSYQIWTLCNLLFIELQAIFVWALRGVVKIDLLPFKW